MPKMAVTLRDVAQEAGVSKTTVVHVLNNVPHFKATDATRRRVVEAAARLGYRRNAIASALTRGRIHTIGVVVPVSNIAHEEPNMSLVYVSAMLSAITGAAHQVGLRVTLIPITNNTPVSVEEVRDGRVDGLILVQVHDRQLVSVLYDTGLPCIAITAEHAPLSVRPDNYGGAILGVEHLVEGGHRRIAHRSIPGSGEAARERRAGFLDAIARFRLVHERCPIVESEEEVKELLRQPADERPTAFFAFNDLNALQVVGMARSLSLRVPEDVSVVGFDNNVLAMACEPPLTTVHNPVAALAKSAISVLQSLWKGEEPQKIPPVPTHLIVRGSTAPPVNDSLLSEGV
jgi:LacI family transcriptional regulator